MSAEPAFKLYEGNGKTLRDRDLALPPHALPFGEEDPANYIAEPGLRDAVNVALTLGQPLLVTGEPGTGKTCLAASIAWELGLNLLTFHTKTTSTPRTCSITTTPCGAFRTASWKRKGRSRRISPARP